ncbi:MAG: PAS domain S-box protein [Alphaproteobacteria bacterium]|uniref:histidine kinase n=1 Tax=Candidatus Nitrobium versatile TaxID=2884831 RepID=A0A953JBR5_9BACT|nr:PAS domain S-box protein [Candidatus Nitrobium versatile]
MTRSFFFKINFLIAAALLSTGILFNVLLREYYQRDERKHIEQWVESLSRIESADFAPHSAKGDYQVIAEEIRRKSAALQSVSDMRLYDRNGLLRADTAGLHPRGTAPAEPWIREGMEKTAPAQRWDGYRLMRLDPLFERNEVVGFLYISFTADFLPRSLEEKRDFFVPLTGFLVMLAILAGLILTRKFLSPLVSIIDTSKKVAEGDLSLSVPVTSGDELGVLARNFNAMVERLAITNAELTHYTKNLEYVIGLRTERLHNVLRELQQQKDFMDTLISTVGALILVLDTGARVVMFNRKCEEVTGFSREEVMGKPIWDFLIPERFLPHARTVFNDLRSNRIPASSYENPCLAKDGKEKFIIWNNTVITGDQAETVYVIGTGIDLTEKKLLEKYLIESQRIQSVATLAAGLSHNLNNLLTGVLGYAGLLRLRLSSLTLPELADAESHIEIIENSSRRASDLIRQLAAFAKKTQYETKRVHPNTIVNDALRVIILSFPKSISIETDLREDVAEIEADGAMIQQVILSICLNARDAMPGGGILRVETLYEEMTLADPAPQGRGGYAVIRIRDTGQGMSEEVRSHIYEPFFTTKGCLNHRGLGLSTAYSIIRSHNGNISVESEPGKGTLFTLRLPIPQG